MKPLNNYVMFITKSVLLAAEQDDYCRVFDAAITKPIW